MKFPIKKMLLVWGMIWTIGPFDLQAKEFGQMPYPVADGEAVVYNNKIYLFGGYSDSLNASVDWIQEFDPSARSGRQWRMVGNMKIARSNFLAKLYNDTVYIVGGRTEPEEEGVQAMETWSFTDDESELFEENDEINRISAAGVVWQNYFLIIGGYYKNTSNNVPSYVVLYNLDTHKIDFSLKGGLGLFMYDQVAALVDSRIFVFGGVRNGISNRIYEISVSFERPQDVRVRPDLLSSRAGFEAVVMDNKVFLIGGYDESEKATSSISEFKVTNSGFEIVDSDSVLIHPRKSLMAASVGGNIYMLGGYDQRDEVVSSIEYLEFASTGVKERETTVERFELKQNYPNPFNSNTKIEFELPRQETVSLDIFTASGQHIKQLLNGFLNSGLYSVVWDGRDEFAEPVASGVYFYKLTSETFTETRKMLLVK